MSALAAPVAFVLSLLSAQANLGSGTTRPAAADDGWRVYRNDHLDFEMEYPGTWTVRSTEPHGNLVEFIPPASEKKSGEVVFGPVQPIREAWFRDFDQWVGKYQHDLSVSGSRLRSRKSIAVAGYPARRVTYEDRLPGMNPRTIVDFLIGVPDGPQSLVYRLFYVTDASRGAGQRDDAIYQRMLSSLKILRPR